MADPREDIDPEEELSALEDAPEEEEQDPPSEAEEAEPAEQPPAEEDESVEEQARRLGWKPKDEWKGDTTNWVDAEEYLEHARNTPATVKRLERQFREQEQRFRKISDLTAQRYKQEIEDLKAQQAQAKEDMNFEAYERAGQRINDLEDAQKEVAPEAPQAPDISRLPSETQAWLQERPQVMSDPAMMEVTKAFCAEAMSMGKASLSEQLSHAEERLKAAYPDKFGGKAPEPPKRNAPPVDPGGLSQPRARREKGWDDVPSEDRSFLENEMIGTDYPDTAKGRQQAARDYFKLNG